MPATYDITLPTSKDRARNQLGDIDMSAPLRMDEEILSQIALYGETGGIAKLARSLAAEYAQQPVSINAQGVGVSWSERVKTWLDLAARLEAALAADQSQANSTFKTIKPTREGPALSEYTRPRWPLSWW